MRIESLLLIAAIAAGGTAHADSLTASGTLTAADPTFNRPESFASLSSTGTAVHYHAYSFSGFATDNYSFRLSTFFTNFASFDPVELLYAGSFDPAHPLANLVRINDDYLGSTTTSLFAYVLSPNVSYTVVVAASQNTGLGIYNVSVTPGVPEPTTLALLLGGLGLVGWSSRGRGSRPAPETAS